MLSLRFPGFVLRAAAILAAAPCLVADTVTETLAQLPRPGVQPLAPLILHGDGNFYGTTSDGGAFGNGTVIRITPAGAVTTLISFTGTGGAFPGRSPVAGLALGASGELFGATISGGAGDFGTVFKVTTAGVFSSLVSFTGSTGPAMGSAPAALVRHSDGFLYGVTKGGGSLEEGTVFKMSAAGALTTLIDFTGTGGIRKGAMPAGPLAINGTDLFGVTQAGGAGGFGTIFKVTTAGIWTLLGEFTGAGGGKVGAGPAAGLVRHTDGNFYGTTEFGGASNFGTVFKINASGSWTLLRQFADTDGSQPAGTLLQGADTALYGTTAGGGASGWGTVFKITTGGAHTLLASLTGESGARPGAACRAGLTTGGDGAFYGTTSAGGPGNAGGIFRITSAGAYSRMAEFSLPNGWTPSGAPISNGNGGWLIPMAEGGSLGGGAILLLGPASELSAAASFGGTLGDFPSGGLLATVNGFFGVTAFGGTANRGTMFKIPAGGAMSIMSSAANSTGGVPEGPLVLGNDGNFYGVGQEGGLNGKGAVYKITPTGTRTRLVSFTGTAGTAPGNKPRGPLAKDAAGNFYGFTELGGAADAGVIFKVTPAGGFTLLGQFAANGPRNPLGGLIPGIDGNFYGATSGGGAGDFGTILRISDAGTVTVMAEFTGPSGLLPGENPCGSLTMSNDGTCYGITQSGGAAGSGVVFRLAPTGEAAVLAEFTGNDGVFPGSGTGPATLTQPAIGGLTWHSDGWVYGAAPGGGNGGGGVLFRVHELTPLEQWKKDHLGSASAPDLADADNDGLSNLVEYALGLSPASPADSGMLPAAATRNAPDGTHLTVTVPRDPSRPDVAVEVQCGETPNGPWTSAASSAGGAPFSGPGYVGGDSPTPGVKTVVIQDPVPVHQSPRRFLRIRVSK